MEIKLSSENMQLLPRLYKGMISLGIGGVLSAAINFGLIFVFSKALSPDEYGVLAVLMIVLVFFEVAPSLGMNGSILMIYFKKKSDLEKQRLVNTVFVATTITSILCLMVVYFFSDRLSHVLMDSNQFAKMIVWVTLGGALQAGINFNKVYLRMREQDKSHAYLDVIQPLLRLILVLTFLFLFKLSVQGVIAATILSLGLTWILSNYQNVRNLNAGFDTRSLGSLLHLGWPILFAWVISWGMNSLDRLMLNHLIDLSTVGIYAFALQLTMSLQLLLVAPIEKIWPSLLFQYESHPDLNNRFKKILSIFLIASCAFVTILLLFADELYYFFLPASYYSSRGYLALTAIIPVMLGLNVFAGSGARLKRKMTAFPIGLVITALIGFQLNMTFIERWGAYGAALATIATHLIMNTLYFYYSQRVHRFDLPWRTILFSFMYLGALAVLHIFIFNLDWLLGLSLINVIILFLIKIALVVSFASFAFGKLKQLKV